jgi:REP element-mobilizing transposase RayT
MQQLRPSGRRKEYILAGLQPLTYMAYSKIWIHAVWATKGRQPILTSDVRINLFKHIKQNADSKGIYIDFINGHTDHVHCLLTLNIEMSIAKAMNLIKGESSSWANKNNLVKPKLEWADEYFAVSVSESMLNKVRDYIKKQNEHHKKIPFQQEYEEFISRYEFVKPA